MDEPTIDFPSEAQHISNLLLRWARAILDAEGALITRDQCAALTTEKTRLHDAITTLKHEHAQAEASQRARQDEMEQGHAHIMAALEEARRQSQAEFEALTQAIAEARAALAGIQQQRETIRQQLAALA